ncbi:3-oxoacyl-ACP synthase III family protein [Streptomyces sp. NPDC056254]|uniref:3-oxoacyl-ACP synthase III family protein n=1 Tax=Streptomyces sp. NPDC056254 TaxID=3345763 RepID=UPI0035DC677C
MAIGIVALGSHVPLRIVDNSQIKAWTGVEPGRIEERTGITSRRYVEPGVTTSQIAAKAVESAFRESNYSLGDVGLTVLATSTPDQPMPATAVRMQRLLKMNRVPAFDVNAVCTGFVYALDVAESMLRRHSEIDAALVVASDIYSTIMDREDWRTVSLFGDGAGAVLVAKVPDGYGIHATRLVADGAYQELVEVIAGGTRQSADAEARLAGAHLFRMKGREVRDYLMSNVPKLVDETLDAAGFKMKDIQRVIIHQANVRLVEAISSELRVPMDRVPLTAPSYGNTGAASVPITLHHSHTVRKLERGERLLLIAAGGGITLGATVMTWY